MARVRAFAGWQILLGVALGALLGGAIFATIWLRRFGVVPEYYDGLQLTVRRDLVVLEGAKWGALMGLVIGSIAGLILDPRLARARLFVWWWPMGVGIASGMLLGAAFVTAIWLHEVGMWPGAHHGRRHLVARFDLLVLEGTKWGALTGLIIGGVAGATLARRRWLGKTCGTDLQARLDPAERKSGE